MKFPWYTRSLLALASGAALALSFPNYTLALLAWVSVGLLALASSGARPHVAPLYGFLHGVVFYPMSLPWIAVVMHQYGNVDPWTSAGILGLMGIAGGIVCSFFSWGVALASRRSRALACALAPLLWVTLEFARGHLPIIAFPWNLIGYAASGNLAFVQLTAVTGIYGLSFVVAAYGSLLAYTVMARTPRAWKTAAAVTAALIVIGVAGPHLVPRATPHHVAHLVQTNFPQSESYPANWLQAHAGELDELERISVNAASRPLDAPALVVWPEVPAPFSLQEAEFAGRMERMARNSRSDILVGVEDWKKDAAGRWIATNSAALLDPSGRRTFTYDKIRLVPFGEYVPLRRWLTFAGRLTADISDFTPGSEYRVGRLHDGPVVQEGSSAGRSPGDTFGVFICYEAIFPETVRRFAEGGAELLISISNDGWFGRSAAPAQHLMMARVRAVENRRWLLRDTNNGFTVSVDPYGRIVAALATDIRGQLDAPYDFGTGLSLYARWGDWFPWLCIAASVIVLLRALVKRKIEKGN